MRNGRWAAAPMLLVAAGALVVGLAMPAAAHEAGSLINGKSIAVRSIPGDRMKLNTLTGHQIKESTLGTVPRAAHARTAAALPKLKWHRITDFTNGWSAYGGSEGPTGYAIDAQGIVHFEGAITAGSSPDAAFAVPAALVSPSTQIEIPVVCSGPSLGEFLIVNDQAAVHNVGSSDCSDISVLEGVTFKAS